MTITERDEAWRQFQIDNADSWDGISMRTVFNQAFAAGYSAKHISNVLGDLRLSQSSKEPA